MVVDGGDEVRSSPGAPAASGATDGKASATVAVAAAAAAGTEPKEPSLPRGWMILLQILAAVAGALLLHAAYTEWDDAPPPQIGTATVEGKESVVTKKTTTTAADDTTTTVEEPAVAAAGRSETVVLGFLAAGTILLFGAALPGRSGAVKFPGGGEIKIDSASRAAVASTAAKGAETMAEKQGADPAEAQAAGVAAAQRAVVMLPANLKEAEPSSLDRVLGRLGQRQVPGEKEIIRNAVMQTVEEAQADAVARVVGPGR
ncbi:MAG TPA: hypothetical protein VFU04_05620 [Solirubrobacterales bacterium]|nr:hypothetical protein [Solirubrobacterales bacterium]